MLLSKEWISSKLLNNHQAKYIECDTDDVIVNNEQDVLDLVAVCGENETNSILIYERNLSPDFFDLKTKLAGTLFQKFANYRMRGAVVISPDQVRSERFEELIYECNRGQLVRFFEDKEAAQRWLTKS